MVIGAIVAWRRASRRRKQQHLVDISIHDLRELQTVGGGAFGQVQRAMWTNNAEVAVKQNGKTCLDRTAIDDERRVLECLAPHVNVVRVFGLCVDAPDGNLRIVMEMCVCSLDVLLRNSPAVRICCRHVQLCMILRLCIRCAVLALSVQPLNAGMALDITLQCIAGLMHVHSYGVLHGDVRSANFLVAAVNPLRVVVSDFGVSKLMDSEGSTVKGRLRRECAAGLKFRSTIASVY
jgi:serine/threonine protein kinase